MKPGYLTSEFWTTAVSSILNVGLAVGVFTAVDLATLGGAATGIITATSALAVNAATIWRYIASREYVKTPQTSIYEE